MMDAELRNASWRVAPNGLVYVNGEEFPYPIAADSIKVQQLNRGRHHLLTMTLLVGPVTLEQRPSNDQRPLNP